MRWLLLLLLAGCSQIEPVKARVAARLDATAPYTRPTVITVSWGGITPRQYQHIGVSNISGGTSLEYDLDTNDVAVGHSVWFRVEGTNFASAFWIPYFR